MLRPLFGVISKYINKPLLGLGLCCLLIACQEDSEPAASVTESKFKSTAETEHRLQAFNEQIHKIKLNGCTLLYNGFDISLGKTVNELKSILGPYDFFHNGYYVWQDEGLLFNHDVGAPQNDETTTRALYLYLNPDTPEEYRENSREALHPVEGYLSMEGVPIDKKLTIAEFLESSHYSLEDFTISNYGYELDFQCPNQSNVRYYITADGTWLYKGSGHLMLKDKPNPNNTSTIELIFITFANDEG